MLGCVCCGGTRLVLGTNEFVEEKGIELEGNTGAILGPDLGN